MKSAYELALERLESQGIEKPREGGYGEAVKAEMAEVRRKAEAKLAELEIMRQDRRAGRPDPEAEEGYLRDRRRIEEERERRLEELRQRG